MTRFEKWSTDAVQDSEVLTILAAFLDCRKCPAQKFCHEIEHKDMDCKQSFTTWATEEVHD